MGRRRAQFTHPSDLVPGPLLARVRRVHRRALHARPHRTGHPRLRRAQPRRGPPRVLHGDGRARRHQLPRPARAPAEAHGQPLRAARARRLRQEPPHPLEQRGGARRDPCRLQPPRHLVPALRRRRVPRPRRLRPARVPRPLGAARSQPRHRGPRRRIRPRRALQGLRARTAAASRAPRLVRARPRPDRRPALASPVAAAPGCSPQAKPRPRRRLRARRSRAVPGSPAGMRGLP